MGDNGPWAEALAGQRLSEATQWRSGAGKTPKGHNSAKSGLLQTSGISMLVGIEKKYKQKDFSSYCVTSASGLSQNLEVAREFEMKALFVEVTSDFA